MAVIRGDESFPETYIYHHVDGTVRVYTRTVACVCDSVSHLERLCRVIVSRGEAPENIFQLIMKNY
jgi:hypothetical protein